MRSPSRAKSFPLWLGTLVSVAAFGCAPEVSNLGSDDGPYARVVDAPVAPRTKLDLLFVVDNSSHMEQRQVELAVSFQQLIARLQNAPRGLPDLHVAVVSTDLGAGTHAGAVPTCSAAGQDGRFVTGQGDSCGLVDGHFLEHWSAESGELNTNYEGELTEAFACMSNLGASGCDYEQPLEAMRTSLSGYHDENLGFLRRDAVLGVVMLTDEDDCSAADPDLFDPDNPSFFDSDPGWRCFASGVTCSDDVFRPGRQEGCSPRENGPFVQGVSPYVDFVSSLKADPRDVVVSAAIGDPSLVQVEVEVDDTRTLAPSCLDNNGVAAYPGIRMQGFVDGLMNDSPIGSLCDGGSVTVLRDTARQLRKALGTTCLEGAIADVDDERAGRQVDCLIHRDWGDGRLEPIEACDRRHDPTNSTNFPCYTVQEGNAACTDFQTKLAVRVYPTAAYPMAPGKDTQTSLEGVRIVGDCRVDAD